MLQSVHKILEPQSGFEDGVAENACQEKDRSAKLYAPHQCGKSTFGRADCCN